MSNPRARWHQPKRSFNGLVKSRLAVAAMALLSLLAIASLALAVNSGSSRAAGGDVILLWDSADGSIPSGWTCISCESGDDFYQRFVRGAPTYGGTGGSDTHTHAYVHNDVSSNGPSASFNSSGSGAVVATATHSHNDFTDATTDSVDLKPEYRQLKLIKSNNPSSLPANVIGMFNVGSSSNLPDGWSHYSAMDGRYLRGEDTASDGGNATHAMTGGSSTSGPPSSTVNRNTGGNATGTSNHTHTVNFGTSPSNSNDPPFVELVFAKLTVDGSIPPTGLLALFDSTSLPGGWEIVSTAGSIYEDNLIKGASAAGSTGGNATHDHGGAFDDRVTGGPSATSGAASCVFIGCGALSTGGHTHANVDFTISSENSLPAHRDVIVGQFQQLSHLTQEAYIFENDDGSSVDTNTQQEAGDTAITDVKRGERVTARLHVKNTGTAFEDDMALFYDRNDGIFTRVESPKPAETGSGDCTDTDFTCEAIDTSNNVGLFTSVAIDGQGNPWVAYYDNTNNDLVVANYVGSGGNCDSSAWKCRVVDNTVAVTGQYASIAFDGQGNPWVSYRTESATTTTMRVARYVGSGGSGCTSSAWDCESVDVSSSSITGQYNSLAFDSQNNPWVAYYDDDNQDVRVATRGGGFGSTCNDADWTCGDVVTSGNAGITLSLAISPDDKPWVSYYRHNTDGSCNDSDSDECTLRVAEYVGSGGSCDDAAWDCTEVDDTAAFVGIFNTLAFDAAGNARIAYRDVTNGTLKLATHVGSGGSCTSAAWDCSTVESDVGGGSVPNVAMAIAPDGALWIVYQHNSDSSTKVAYLKSGQSASGNCSANWVCTTVDNDIGGTTNTGSYPSLAFAADGKPWMSYYDATGGDAKIATTVRGGEITISPGLAGDSGDTISESHADMTSVGDSANRDDADCVDAAASWNDGAWFATATAPAVTLPDGSATAQCSEFAFTIDTSQAQAGTTYRLVLATHDNWRADKGAWRGLAQIDEFATLTMEDDTDLRVSKDRAPSWPDCTNTDWGCVTVDNSAADTGVRPRIAFGPDGTPWVVYDNDTDTELMVATYVGSGGSCTDTAWDCETVDDSDTNTASIAFGPDGTPWVSYHEAGANDLKVARRDGAGSGSCTDTAWNCSVVDEGGNFGQNTDITAGSDGSIWVAYRDSSSASLRVATYVGSGGSCTDTAWDCYQVDNTHASGNTSIALSRGGIPWIAYRGTNGGSPEDLRLKVATYVGSGGSCGHDAWDCTIVDNNDIKNGYDPSLAFDASNNPWVTYYTRGDGTCDSGGECAIKIATYVGSGGSCTDTAWDCSKLDDGSGQGGGSLAHIAFDPTGNAWVAYHKATNDIRFARHVGSGGSCTDTAWDCGDIQTSDTLHTPALAFDASGTPWVSYHNNTDGALELAKLHLPPTKPSAEAPIPHPHRSAGSGDARWRLDAGESPRGQTGCSATPEAEGYCGVAVDDGDTDAVAAGSDERPLYVAAQRFSSNTTAPYLVWTGRTTVAPDTTGDAGDIVLQVYRHGSTNGWETVTTDSTSSDCSTANCTVEGEPSGTASEYFEADGANYWVYFRIWQHENTSGSETLKTDSFSANVDPPSFEQSAYRLFENADSTDVGTALAAQDTAATLASGSGEAFRLRLLLHVGNRELESSGQELKLQVAQQSGTCDTDFTGESYSDVDTASGDIIYNDNATPTDGSALSSNANDPAHGSHTTNDQTYEEANNFNNDTSAIPRNEDGMWDFSLADNSGGGVTLCFRAVKSDGSPLDTYTVIPEVTVPTTSGPTTEQLLRHGAWFDGSGAEQPFFWAD